MSEARVEELEGRLGSIAGDLVDALRSSSHDQGYHEHLEANLHFCFDDPETEKAAEKVVDRHTREAAIHEANVQALEGIWQAHFGAGCGGWDNHHASYNEGSKAGREKIAEMAQGDNTLEKRMATGE